MKALYGFSPDLPPFRDKTTTQQVTLLRSWGADAIFGGYADPAFVDAIHDHGMKIYAEFGCFRGKEWWEEVPESRPIQADDSPLEPVEWYYGVNPSVPTVREQLLERLATLLQAHELDGLWLDFIRWPCRWESPAPRLPQTSFDAATVARFTAENDIDENAFRDWQNDPAGALHDYAQQWTQWRIDQVTTWVAEARAIVNDVRPSAQLGLFAIPWQQSDFGGAIHTIIGQDFAALAPYIDIFSPMTYHLMCGQPVPWIANIASEVAELTGKPVWPVIQSVDHPTTLSNTAYTTALETASSTTDGVIVFTLAGVIEGERIAATQQMWRGDAG